MNKIGVEIMNNNISLIGIGKLGICFALNLEAAGYNVLGVDINQKYVDSINNKTLKSFEPQVEEMLAKCEKNFHATVLLKDAVEFSDMIFIVVATPSLLNGRYDHSQVDGIIEQLIALGKQPDIKYLTICCTVMPGYSDTVQERLNDYNYIVSYNPEFIAQGKIIYDQRNPDIILIGEGNADAGDRLEQLYGRLCTWTQNDPVKRMSRKAAEITKISLNCFMTTKIAFANMIGDIAIDAGVGTEIDKMLDAIGSDKRVGNRCLKFGYGYGGPCFPRDNRALAIFSNDIGAYSDISKASDRCNTLHFNHQFDMIREKNRLTGYHGAPIVFESVTYKPGTVILEESQQLKLAVMLANYGFKVHIREQSEVIRQLKELYGDIFTYEEKIK